MPSHNTYRLTWVSLTLDVGYQEQYCIGTWNVRSMNQGKLKVVKQEMARVNVDILGISELKWTGMGEFNSDEHCIYLTIHSLDELLFLFGTSLLFHVQF